MVQINKLHRGFEANDYDTTETQLEKVKLISSWLNTKSDVIYFHVTIVDSLKSFGLPITNKTILTKS